MSKFEEDTRRQWTALHLEKPLLESLIKIISENEALKIEVEHLRLIVANCECEEEHQMKGVSEMSNEEKLALLNSIPVNDYDTDSEDLYTVTCEDTPENRKKIIQLGYTVEQINYFLAQPGSIEMTHFAWEIATSALLGNGFERWCID